MDTPERVRFRYPIAGPGPRGVAWAIDAALILAVLSALSMGILLTGASLGLGTASMGVILVLSFAFEWLYSAGFETWWSGRTPGKALLGLRVVRTDAAPASGPDFLLRNLLKAVDFLPALFGIGALVMVVDGRMRRVGDLVAGTVVIHERRSVLRAPLTVPPPTDVERATLPPRVVLSTAERRAIEQLLTRAAALGPDRTEELAGRLGPVIGERTGIRAEGWTRVLALAWARATGRLP